MEKTQIKDSLDENIKLLKSELLRGAPIGELRHLVGRIGELYVADMTKGEMAIYTNQKGFDVLSNQEKISVKTTTSIKASHQFYFNRNTLNYVDRIIIIGIYEKNKDIDIKILFDADIKTAKKLMIERDKYAISLSKLNNIQKYVNNNDKDFTTNEADINQVIIPLHTYSFKLKEDIYSMVIKGNVVRLTKNGVNIEHGYIRGELKNMNKLLKKPTFRENGKSFTNIELAKRFIR